MWSLIRLTSLNWCCIKTHTHTRTHTCWPLSLPPQPGHPPRQPELPEWSMSLSSRAVSGAPGRAGEPLRPGSGLTLADTGWVMSAFYSRGWRRQGIWLGQKQWAWRKVTAQPGVINKTRSWVSPMPLSISVATSCPNCICTGSRTQKEVNRQKKHACITKYS